MRTPLAYLAALVLSSAIASATLIEVGTSVTAKNLIALSSQGSFSTLKDCRALRGDARLSCLKVMKATLPFQSSASSITKVNTEALKECRSLRGDARADCFKVVQDQLIPEVLAQSSASSNITVTDPSACAKLRGTPRVNCLLSTDDILSQSSSRGSSSPASSLSASPGTHSTAPTATAPTRGTKPRGGGGAPQPKNSSSESSSTAARGPTASSLALESGTNPTTWSGSVRFTATVSPSDATGIITFLDGVTVIGTGAIAQGSGVLRIPTLAVGSHSITATYPGDSNYLSSVSDPVVQVVNKASTITTVVTSSGSVSSGTVVRFTATVSPSAATGTITFKDGATTIATVTMARGSGSFTSSGLTIASHSITAVYSGNQRYLTSTSSAITQTIIAFLPTMLSNLQLWLDPNDTSTMTFRNVPSYNTGAVSSMHVVAGNATNASKLNFASDPVYTKAGIHFKIRFQGTRGGSIMGKVTPGSNINSAWAMYWGGSTGFNGGQMRFDVLIHSGSTAGQVSFNQNNVDGLNFDIGKVYDIVLNYDGSAGATNGAKMQLYVNGISATMVSPTANTLPRKFNNPTGAASSFRTYGYNGANATSSFELYDLVMMKRIFTTGERSAFRDYTKSTLGDISASDTDLVAAWSMNDGAGQPRVDLSANAITLSESGSVTNVRRVKTWTDKSPNALVFRAYTGTSIAPVLDGTFEPQYVSNVFGTGKSGVGFLEKYPYLTAYVSNWSNTTTGNIFQNLRYDLAPTNETFDFLTGSDISDAELNGNMFLTGMYGSLYSGPGRFGHVLRFDGQNQPNSKPNGQIDNVGGQNSHGISLPQPGDIYPQLGVAFSREVSAIDNSTGSTTTPGPYRFYHDGTPETLYVGEGGAGSASKLQNGWMTRITNRSLVQVGLSDLGISKKILGDIVIYGPTISDSNRARMRSWLRARR